MAPLIKCDADFVIGNRFKGRILKNAMPWLHRYIGNPNLTKILNRLFKTEISDAHWGMRAFTREAYEKMNLKTGGMEFASEMVIEAARKNLRIKEVVKVYYAVPAEAKLIGSYPVKVPGVNITEKTKLIIADESYLKFSEMVFSVSLVLLTITLIALLLVTKNGLLATIPLYLASLYFLYYFYLNPLRIHNFTLAIFLSSSLISSALTYKT